MKKTSLLTLLFIFALSAYLSRGLWWQERFDLLSPLGQGKIQKDTKFTKYSFPSLSQRVFTGSEIRLEKEMKKRKDEKGFTPYLFSYKVGGKKVTGQANIPEGAKSADGFPVIVMVRGYIDDQVYFTGAGTYKAAAVFAENGFLTLAPDFLGFGGSDEGSADILENRFQRPETILELLVSVKNLDYANPNRVGIWGHSNGGQISLSVLEISQKPYPTSLWAPVTKGFPESVTNYMGELDDKGLIVKTAIDNFLHNYDPKEFSIDSYYGKIKAPLQIQQGTYDNLVPVEWSDQFTATMKAQGTDIKYYTYPKNDHNLKQDWDTAIERDLEFFKNHL